MAADKPRDRGGYSLGELELVRSTCLTVAVTLGDYLEDICIVGGLVPTLLAQSGNLRQHEEQPHVGTNDLDIGLALAVMSDERYAEISARLRAEGFEPDKNDEGNPTVQRWRLGDLKVTLDFLISPMSGQMMGGTVKKLESDFGALTTPGLGLAFSDRIWVELSGHTLKGEAVTRKVPVCGPATFVVLKALAFGNRGEPKDAYDLDYTLAHHPYGAGDLAERLVLHASKDLRSVRAALEILDRDYATLDHLGPRRGADFMLVDAESYEGLVADIHGRVQDLLKACRAAGLIAD